MINSVKFPISIITVVKNHEVGLKETIKSVVSQDFGDWELIIVVGSSLDNTKVIAKCYENKYENVRVVNQEGNGIYEAMNLGLSIARGNYVWFMNAGDCFYDSKSLSSGLAKIQEFNADLCIGGHSVQGMEKRRTYAYSEKRLKASVFAFTRRGACHQSMIYKRDSLIAIGGFCTEYLICTDFDSALRIMTIGQAVRINSLVSRVEPGGGADKNLKFVILEKQRVRKAHLSKFIVIVVGLPWTFLALSKIYFKKWFSILLNARV